MPCMYSCTQVTCCTIVEMTSQPGSGFPMTGFTGFGVYRSGCVSEVCGSVFVEFGNGICGGIMSALCF